MPFNQTGPNASAKFDTYNDVAGNQTNDNSKHVGNLNASSNANGAQGGSGTGVGVGLVGTGVGVGGRASGNGGTAGSTNVRF